MATGYSDVTFAKMSAHGTSLGRKPQKRATTLGPGRWTHRLAIGCKWIQTHSASDFAEVP